MIKFTSLVRFVDVYYQEPLVWGFG